MNFLSTFAVCYCAASVENGRRGWLWRIVTQTENIHLNSIDIRIVYKRTIGGYMGRTCSLILVVLKVHRFVNENRLKFITPAKHLQIVLIIGLL